MSSPRRWIRSLATLVGTGALATAGLAAVAPTADAGLSGPQATVEQVVSGRATFGHPAGVIGRLTLGEGQVFPSGHPYDVATGSNGTSYIGWVSSTTTDPVRRVHLCSWLIGQATCSGGIQTIASLGDSSANDLFVVLTGDDVVHLIWHHDVLDPQNGAIAEATAPHGLNLTQGTDVVTDAPGLLHLLDVQVDPDGGAIWTVGYAGTPAQNVQVRSGLTAPPTTLSTPYDTGYAQLGFTGYLSGKPVLAVERYGAITAAVNYATRSGGAWSSFHAVAHTWAVGTNAVLKATRHGLRLVTGVDNATYRPAISTWTGSGFSPRHLTADSNGCSPSTHDGWADLSARLLDVSWECNRITITNYADAFHAAILRLGATEAPTLAPQIGSGIRGIATVAYSRQTPNADALDAARVRLPDSTSRITKTGYGGRVTVTGPRSCLPPVNVHIDWTHHAAADWTFKSGSLRLEGGPVAGTPISESTLDGATLAPGYQFTLVGSALFGRGSDRTTVETSLTFVTCGAG